MDDGSKGTPQPTGPQGASSRWHVGAIALVTLGVILFGVVIGEAFTPGNTRGQLGFFTWNISALHWVRMAHLELGWTASAAVAAIALLVGARRVSPRIERTALTVLAVCAVLAGALSIGRLGLMRPRAFGIRDDFQYLLSIKYFDELGYTGLYECALTSELERRERIPKHYRNLETNRGASTTELRARVERGDSPCKSAFSPERWKQFRNDVKLYRRWLTSPGYWERAFLDHGYNGTPVLTAVLSPFARAVPTSHRGLTLLGCVNLTVLMAMFACVLWAFGDRVALTFAVIFFATSVDGFGHATGLPRYLWLASLVCALCMFHRDRHAAAGALLTFATSLKLFPGAFLAAAAGAVAWRWLRNRTLAPPERRFVTACAVMGVSLLLLSISHGHHLQNWPEFLHQMKIEGFRLSPGRIGFQYNFLRPLSTQSYAWALERFRHPLLLGITPEHLRWLAAGVLYAALLRRATSLRDADWTLVLGFALFFLSVAPMRYYYSGFLGLPLLFAGDERRRAWLASAVYLLVVVAVGRLLLRHFDERVVCNGYHGAAFTVYLVGIAAYLNLRPHPVAAAT